MQISRSSWHYKVYQWQYKRRKGYDYDRSIVNLCPYMRGVLLWAPFLAIFGHWGWITIPIGICDSVGIGPSVIPTLLLSWLLPKYLGYFSYELKIALWVAFGLVWLVAILACALLAGIHHIESNRTYVYSESKGPSKFRQLLRAYIKASHDKICPSIDLVDETNEQGPLPNTEQPVNDPPADIHNDPSPSWDDGGEPRESTDDRS